MTLIEAEFDLRLISKNCLGYLELDPERKLAVKKGFIANYLVMLKMLHLRHKMNPKRPLASIPVGVFREIIAYV